MNHFPISTKTFGFASLILLLACSVVVIGQEPKQNGIDKYRIKFGTEYAVGDLTPSLCQLAGVPAPKQCVARPYPPLIKLAEKCYKGKQADRMLVFCPDAIGDSQLQKFPEEFVDLKKETDIIALGTNVMPSITPVCFATIFTGAPPEIHGIHNFERPALTIECIYDSFRKNGKRTAICAEKDDSVMKLFQNRENVDYYFCKNAEDSFQTGKDLIRKNEHNLIVIYDAGYDHTMHSTGIGSAQAIEALRLSVKRYLELVKLTDECWAKHNRLTVFAPDHGSHDTKGGKGSHGTELPDDMLVNHYYRLRPLF